MLLVYTAVEDIMIVSISNEDIFYDWKFYDKKFMNTNKYIGSIIHNSENRAMLNFIEIKTGLDMYRTEINPLGYEGDDDWTVDYQIKLLPSVPTT